LRKVVLLASKATAPKSWKPCTRKPRTRVPTVGIGCPFEVRLPMQIPAAPLLQFPSDPGLITEPLRRSPAPRRVSRFFLILTPLRKTDPRLAPAAAVGQALVRLRSLAKTSFTNSPSANAAGASHQPAIRVVTSSGWRRPEAISSIAAGIAGRA
jgi:hypothetical protein